VGAERDRPAPAALGRSQIIWSDMSPGGGALLLTRGSRGLDPAGSSWRQRADAVEGTYPLVVESERIGGESSEIEQSSKGTR
jgi:hypothetical protein